MHAALLAAEHDQPNIIGPIQTSNYTKDSTLYYP